MAYLSDLYDELLKMTLDSWCGLTSGAPEKTATSIFDSFKKMALKRINDNSSFNTAKKSVSSSISSDGSRTPTQVSISTSM